MLTCLCTVYLGSSASLSFLILLRDTLTKYTGRSTFEGASQSAVMLEDRSPLEQDASSTCSHTIDENRELLDIYSAAVRRPLHNGSTG